ncbi:MAG TPA: ABC transporter ATP-binding protein [Candidatus Brocadiia bacterium]|nr:ABC transporter ATP-binding protein [Candidatus Brocadiia bacterium]
MLLSIENLRKTFKTPVGEIVVLDDVSAQLHSGEVMAVLGPSGSGKSTLLNIVGSLDRPTSGIVRLDKTVVTELDEAGRAQYRASSVGFVFQDHLLLPQCTVLENALLPTLAVGRSPSAAVAAMELLTRLGLGDRLDAFPAHLSTGQRQRAAIARAMMNRPPLLLCDEPTGNLDRETGDHIGDLFLELAAQNNVMLMVVTHNLAFARRFPTVMELRDGRLAEYSGDE